jgi:hypothetical protein
MFETIIAKTPQRRFCSTLKEFPRPSNRLRQLQHVEDATVELETEPRNGSTL